MSVRHLRAGVVALAAAAVTTASGCSSSGADPSTAENGAPRSPTAAGSEDDRATSITFSEPSLVLVPGQARTLGVTVAPPGVYTVRLSLIGDAADAYLDAGEISTTAAGEGTFTLTAPSSPRTFSVRASVGTRSAEIEATPATGYRTIEVVPVYSGRRKIAGWVGTVSTGSRCDTTAVPPPDGELTSATPPDRPQVGNAPVGTELTVTVRAGHFAGGCVHLSRIVGDSADGAFSVSVPATDRPLSLDSVTLPLRLGVDTSMEWIDAWTALVTSMQDAFCPPLVSDASALLDAMGDVTPTGTQADFKIARTLHAWDEKLGASLEASIGKHALDSAVKKWLEAGLPAQAAFTGTLTTSKTGVPALTLSEVSGLPVDAVGFPGALGTVSLTASPDDHVVFGGTTREWKPAALAAALALSPARVDFPAAESVPQALATLVSCADVANVLLTSGSSAFSGCSASCVRARCENALATMWDAAAALEGTGTLEVSGSAAITEVADTATPTALDGTWVGTVHLDTTATHVGGAVSSAPDAP